MLARPALPLIAVVLLSGCPKNLKLPDLSAYTPKVRGKLPPRKCVA